MLVWPLMVDAFAMTFAWCHVNSYSVNISLALVQLCPTPFRALSYCQLNEEEKEKDSDVNLITDTHNHALLDNSEAVHGNKMILRSYCSLGTPHRGRARKALRAAWGQNTTTVNTHIRIIYAHTHARARHGGEWIRSEGQTPSHHGNDIPATAVCLTSTSGPKPLLLA